jgi:membrane protein DedA with SNARE-associated domain
VHAAVVFAPLSAVSALAYVGLPKYRDRLRWVTLVLVLIGFVSIWAAYLTGNNFYASARFDHVSGNIKDKIDHHQSLARVLRWIMTGFTVVTVLAVWQHQRQGAARYVLSGLVVVGAILTLVWTIMTGDAGAQAVWGS